jgi:hypothetical protein
MGNPSPMGIVKATSLICIASNIYQSFSSILHNWFSAVARVEIWLVDVSQAFEPLKQKFITFQIQISPSSQVITFRFSQVNHLV